MKLNSERLESFKQELQARKAALIRGLHETNAGFLEDQEVFHADTVDQASADSDKTLVLQIKNRDARILGEIDEALRRIDLGVFGECESCGEQISFARMKANPACTLCLECKSELESEQARFTRQA